MSNEKKRKKSSRKYVTLLDREFPFQTTEAFKSLRANLIFSLSTRPNKVFAVTSAMQHEGKSTVAANLAITFAQMEAKVLVIDADLRKPVQHKMFKQKNKAGLSTLLAGMTAFKDVVCENVIPGLDVLVSGPIPPNPSEMLASDNMKQLIKELADYYDYIIIDTPPVNIRWTVTISGIPLAMRLPMETMPRAKQIGTPTKKAINRQRIMVICCLPSCRRAPWLHR